MSENDDRYLWDGSGPPDPDVVRKFVGPVSWTVAPGVAAPVWSITVPETLAVCANAGTARDSTKHKITATRIIDASMAEKDSAHCNPDSQDRLRRDRWTFKRQP